MKKRRPTTASELATDFVYEVGLQLPDRPGDDEFPELPDDLTDLTDNDLMLLFRRHVSWHNYAASQLAMLEVDEEELSARTREEEAVAYLEKFDDTMAHGFPSRAPIGNLIKAERDADDEVVLKRDRQRVVYAKRKLVGSIVTSLERSISLISRELTRRTSSLSSINRDGKWGGG